MESEGKNENKKELDEQEKDRKEQEIKKTEVKVFLVDGGYSGDKFANTIKKIHSATVKLVKRNKLHQFGILPKRWIVERYFR